MSKGRHRPFRDVAKRLRAERQRERQVSAGKKARRFEDLARREGVVRLTDEPRQAPREPSDQVPSPARVPEIVVRDADGRLEGWRAALGPRAVRGLADGEPRATLDLHGLGADDARRAVLAFLRRRRERGETVVRVVVGKGRHSEGGFGVLRAAIGAWLVQPPAAHHVRAFVSASPRNGGTGALMIRLQSPAGEK